MIDLTEAAVKALPLLPKGGDKKDEIHRDKKLTGFCCRVTSNSKSFFAEYNQGTSKRREALGKWGVVTVAAARKQAQDLLGQVAGGHDVVMERRAKEEATAIDAERAALTLERLTLAWELAHQDTNRPSYLREAVACVRRNSPTWWNRPAHQMTPRDAVKLLDAIREKEGISDEANGGGTTTNRTLAYSRAIFNWAIKRHMLEVNPFANIEAPGSENARERFLTVDESRAVWDAAGQMPLAQNLIRFLLLTAQRRSEVARMRWSELDNAEAPTVWTVPADHSKNRKANVVHLSPAAIAILQEQPRIEGVPFVFSGSRSNKAFDNWSNVKVAIDALLPADMEPWIWHDFRRSAVTLMASKGVQPHVADKILNHKNAGAISGVAAVYQRFEFLPEKAAALDIWCAALTDAPAPSNVIQLRA